MRGPVELCGLGREGVEVKIRKSLALAFVATLALLVSNACFDSFTVDQAQDQNHHNVTEAKPSPSPSASPSPGGQQGLGPIVGLKVNFLDGAPGAGDKVLKVGEKSTVTASPLNAAGQDPCKGITNEACTLYSQSDIAWVAVSTGVTGDCAITGTVVAATDAGAEKYNRDVKACAEGAFTITAIFRSTISGSLSGTVVKP